MSATKTETKPAEKSTPKPKAEVFSNVKKQDESLAQVTQLQNPGNIKADKDGTLRITTPEKAKK